MVKKAQQRLFKLRRLKKFGLLTKTLTNLYRCTIESILSGMAPAPPITSWLGFFSDMHSTWHMTARLNKTKEMIVDFRKQQREHPPIHIDGKVVERVAVLSSSAYTSQTN